MTGVEKFSHLGRKRIHVATFRKIFNDLMIDGQFVAPRGQLILELENYSYTLKPYIRFQNFKCRNLNVPYIKREFLWYLKGDKFDRSIAEYAKIWRDIINKDGSINSNYGQYIFNEGHQFDNVVATLMDDRDSRRASMVILDRRHLLSDTRDVPCTYGLNFRIRDSHLNMTVHMRSQDAIYGMGSDAPIFSFIHEMVYNALKRKFMYLKYGAYFHIADSFHVYQRHFEMLMKITGVKFNVYPDLQREKYKLRHTMQRDSYDVVKCPRISGPDEVDFMRGLHKLPEDHNWRDIPPEFKFTLWLLNRNYDHGPKRDAQENLIETKDTL